jgi:hypothetical protein
VCSDRYRENLLNPTLKMEAAGSFKNLVACLSYYMAFLPSVTIFASITFSRHKL